ncbi:hypothetical protein DHD05_06195 [Arenibacter sp. N53]|uniref:hypothetical protein n=1 Tax=Arenibacter TaxID=178469 RepID=UPI000CD42A0A|nr:MULTISPECIES: hypothetical protein [Arenibacter]MCM4151176.1 hypothetical protein [Arenibacter sp. N53]
MRKSLLYFVFTLLFTVSLTALNGCREDKSAGEKIKDGVEKVGEDIEEGVEEIGDEIDDATDDN